ncbi:hypothetical protein [Paraburkholderia heleia]|uniref:hypothetical protein n=1 Tax=Paraburkholderia heleia TaxID=634127 RepID=UPI002AB62403|nr:hypothetical protein [Paraburkholderia heleia]
MKNLLFERHIGTSTEQVGISLYRVATGFIAERFVVQGNQRVAVQVLPILALADFEGFASSDPHYPMMRAIYGEVRQLVWGNQG